MKHIETQETSSKTERFITTAAGEDLTTAISPYLQSLPENTVVTLIIAFKKSTPHTE